MVLTLRKQKVKLQKIIISNQIHFLTGVKYEVLHIRMQKNDIQPKKDNL